MNRFQLACPLIGAIAALSMPAAALAAPDGGAAPGNADAALAQLSAIVELARNPHARQVEKLASRLDFSYRETGCHPTDQFASFCQYQVQERAAAPGHILILALGNDKATGSSGGRVVWGMPRDRGCISKASAAPLLGAGHFRSADMPEPIAGVPVTAAPSEEVVYRSIPGAAPSARAVVSYRDNCINQVFLDF